MISEVSAESVFMKLHPVNNADNANIEKNNNTNTLFLLFKLSSLFKDFSFMSMILYMHTGNIIIHWIRNVNKIGDFSMETAGG